MTVERRVPESADELYELFMRAAWGISKSVEAAYKLAFEVEEVRDWLIAERLISMKAHNGIEFVEIDFSRCSARLEGYRRDSRESVLSKSGVAVVGFVVSLAGVGSLNIRLNSVLSREDAKRVAEAVMYASGYMDGVADPAANDGPKGGDGPNAIAHDRRIDELLV